MAYSNYQYGYVNNNKNILLFLLFKHGLFAPIIMQNLCFKFNLYIKK